MMSFYGKSRHSVSHINTWTVSLQYSSTDSGKKNVARMGHVFGNVQRAVYFNQGNKGVDKMPSIARKIVEKKEQKSFIELVPKNRVNANN